MTLIHTPFGHDSTTDDTGTGRPVVVTGASPALGAATARTLVVDPIGVARYALDPHGAQRLSNRRRQLLAEAAK